MKKLIVIEGTDGSGKKTQADMLRNNFMSLGLSVVEQSFPNHESLSAGPVHMYLGGELCEKADDFDAYQSSVLYSVDRLCTMQKFKNDDSDVGVFDRYVQSNIIHQGSKIKSRAKLIKYIKWLYNLEFGLLKLQKPNMIIFLNMPPEKSIALAHARKESKTGLKKDIQEQDSEHLIKAYQTGMWVAKKLKWKIINCVNEAGEIKTKEQIQKEIFEVAKQVL